MKNKKVAVIGYGLEGKDLVSYLIKKGFEVTVFDRKEKQELGLLLESENINYKTGKKYLSHKLDEFEVIYRSPGVYRYKRKLMEAERKGQKISSATQLFFEKCPAKIIGVTGTKGKGTTCSLIYNILKKSKKDVYLAGNIGKPFLKILPKLNKESWVVMELSSFQLIDLKKSPHISVVLNITQDHLDWHRDLKEYKDAKKNIVKFQGKKDFAILNFDHKIVESFKDLTKAKVYFTSIKEKTNGCYVKDNKIFLVCQGKNKLIGEVNKLILRGKHNWENVNSAVMASYLAKADLNFIKEEVFSFKGLEHRLEYVKSVNGIGFYNDSFATGPSPTIAAIKSFREPITLILGGYDKGLSYTCLFKEIKKAKNLKNIILIGNLEEKFNDCLTKESFKGKLILMGKSKVSDIVSKAFQISKKGGVVLFSPAAASFDMFLNYKERGDLFKEAVNKL